MIPPKLKKGDTIGIFSPSSPASATAPIRYQRALTFLRAKGFKIKEGILVGKQDFYRSGSIKARAEELNSLIRNPNVTCIMAIIGGMNSNALLPYIDYEALKQHPKIIIGYSDVTAILLGIYEKTGIITYYGPTVVASFGEFPPFVEQTFHYFLNVVGISAKFPYQIESPVMWSEERIEWEQQTRAKIERHNTIRCLQPGRVSGRLIGGNLNTFQGIYGTPYFPYIQTGDILFIEDSYKDIATVERSLTLLYLSGVFERIAGLIIGKHEQFDDKGSGRCTADVLLEIIGIPTFPVIVDFDCAHTHPIITLPIGATVQLDATNVTLTILTENDNPNEKGDAYDNFISK